MDHDEGARPTPHNPPGLWLSAMVSQPYINGSEVFLSFSDRHRTPDDESRRNVTSGSPFHQVYKEEIAIVKFKGIEQLYTFNSYFNAFFSGKHGIMPEVLPSHIAAPATVCQMLSSDQGGLEFGSEALQPQFRRNLQMWETPKYPQRNTSMICTRKNMKFYWSKTLYFSSSRNRTAFGGGCEKDSIASIRAKSIDYSTPIQNANNL
ncbi:hypothetical protein FA13DRAFT_1777899 [Coprinellus micaceus]|uniref:Uncharacterized protein n=1 Tax=Coprinellus micaceus TaxID=71717 RepID=A0A4Y7SQV3_COPMI|nr:hypothetical protein FA13DRAFT_1777899 [Coprinellus micaceus]